MPWANYAGKMVTRRSTFSQPSVNLVNLHDAWQWDSGFAFTHHAGIGFALRRLGRFGVKGVIHHMVECLHRQPIPRILLVGVHALVE